MPKRNKCARQNYSFQYNIWYIREVNKTNAFKVNGLLLNTCVLNIYMYSIKKF